MSSFLCVPHVPLVQVMLHGTIRNDDFLLKFLLVESGILGFGISNTAQGTRNPNNDWNPESRSWNLGFMECRGEKLFDTRPSHFVLNFAAIIFKNAPYCFLSVGLSSRSETYTGLITLYISLN